jgi:hypothetical protein
LEKLWFSTDVEGSKALKTRVCIPLRVRNITPGDKFLICRVVLRDLVVRLIPLYMWGIFTFCSYRFGRWWGSMLYVFTFLCREPKWPCHGRVLFRPRSFSGWNDLKRCLGAYPALKFRPVIFFFWPENGVWNDVFARRLTQILSKACPELFLEKAVCSAFPVNSSG